AAPIFNMHGYEGTSMSQLTKAINMTKGAIYGNFKDKDEIALAAFDYNISKILEKIERVVGLKKNANDQLIALATFYLDGFSEISKHGGCPVLNAAVDSDFVHPRLKERVAQAIEAWTDYVARIIEYGIKEKQISQNTKSEQFSSIFVSLIEGGIMLSRATGSIIHLSRSIDHIIYLINTDLRI
ncbi:MAG: TetR/AcrR family transcriptional regulator, partial [Desulfobacterium sp.]